MADSEINIQLDTDTDTLEVWGPPDEKGFCEYIGRLVESPWLGGDSDGWTLFREHGEPVDVPADIVATHDLTAVAAWVATLTSKES